MKAIIGLTLLLIASSFQGIEDASYLKNSEFIPEYNQISGTTLDSINDLIDYFAEECLAVVKTIVEDDIDIDSLEYYFINDPNGDEMADLFGMTVSELVDYNTTYNSKKELLRTMTNRYYNENVPAPTVNIGNPITSALKSNVEFGQANGGFTYRPEGSGTTCENAALAACYVGAIAISGPIGALAVFVCYCSFCEGETVDALCGSSEDPNYYEDNYS